MNNAPNLENFVYVNSKFRLLINFECSAFFFNSQNKVSHRLENFHDFEIVNSGPLITLFKALLVILPAREVGPHTHFQVLFPISQLLMFFVVVVIRYKTVAVKLSISLSTNVFLIAG